jgi:aspartyl-tRNA(Asn)/glutamyl-tRNA(Gln) amidotransferase subunit A
VAVNAAADPSELTVARARRELAAGRLGAVELVEAVLARVERLNPELNAYLRVDREAALAQARDADRRESHDAPALTGIPICVKDMIDVAGVPTTAGAARWQRMPERDAAAVAALRAAGAIVVGKGHTNEFAYGIDGQNPHWGNCRNPYDPSRLCGGSSSGPAVATAAGMALAGLGTDTTGSIRAPASLCGLVGVRPTPRLVPVSGVVPLAWSYDTVGPLVRSVEDAGILLAILSGPAPGSTRSTSLPDLRIGLLEQLLDAAEPYVADGVLAAAQHLESLGARLVTVRLETLKHAPAVHHVIQHAEAAGAHQPWFHEQRSHYSGPVRLRLEAGRLLPATAYLTAQRARRLLIDDAAAKMATLDVMLAPTTPCVAPPQDVEEVTIRGVRHELRPALLSCVLGPSELACPVVSVPVGSHEGLPYGMQVIGPPHSEPLLLDVAGACEERWPWPERRPVRADP